MKGSSLTLLPHIKKATSEPDLPHIVKGSPEPNDKEVTESNEFDELGDLATEEAEIVNLDDGVIDSAINDVPVVETSAGEQSSLLRWKIDKTSDHYPPATEAPKGRSRVESGASGGRVELVGKEKNFPF